MLCYYNFILFYFIVLYFIVLYCTVLYCILITSWPTSRINSYYFCPLLVREIPKVILVIKCNVTVAL